MISGILTAWLTCVYSSRKPHSQVKIPKSYLISKPKLETSLLYFRVMLGLQKNREDSTESTHMLHIQFPCY